MLNRDSPIGQQELLDVINTWSAMEANTGHVSPLPNSRIQRLLGPTEKDLEKVEIAAWNWPEGGEHRRSSG